MSEVIIKVAENGSLDFGNYKLPEKTKVSDFEVNGDYYKVKTFNEITKLEKNDLFMYESVPGTNVAGFVANNDGVCFAVCGEDNTQVTLGLAEDEEYEVLIDDVNVGRMTTNISGKLSLSVELAKDKPVNVKVVRR